MLKQFLIVTALIELAAGVALLRGSSRVVDLLLGEGLTSPQSLVLGRVAGAALVSIGVACWLTRTSEPDGQRRLVAGVLIYNAAVPALLMNAAFFLGTHGIVLWPVTVLHIGLAIWCVSAFGDVSN